MKWTIRSDHKHYDQPYKLFVCVRALFYNSLSPVNESVGNFLGIWNKILNLLTSTIHLLLISQFESGKLPQLTCTLPVEKRSFTQKLIKIAKHQPINTHS